MGLYPKNRYAVLYPHHYLKRFDPSRLFVYTRTPENRKNVVVYEGHTDQSPALVLPTNREASDVKDIVYQLSVLKSGDCGEKKRPFVGQIITR